MNSLWRIGIGGLAASFALGFLVRDNLGITLGGPSTRSVSAAPAAHPASGSESFTCQWTAGGPAYKVVISVRGSKAYRDDGGTTYTVMSNSPDAVVMIVDSQIGNQLTFQIIDKRSGGWSDHIVIGSDVQGRIGGYCAVKDPTS